MVRARIPPMLKLWLAHIMFAMSLLALGYAAKSYVLLVEVLEPNVEALAPVTAEKIAEAISLQLPASEQGESARTLLHGQVGELRTLHETWLALTKSQVIYARIQLIASALVCAVSLGLLAVLHLGKANAG